MAYMGGGLNKNNIAGKDTIKGSLKYLNNDSSKGRIPNIARKVAAIEKDLIQAVCGDNGSPPSRRKRKVIILKNTKSKADVFLL
tara:strand:- start:525 stop:776 length:252 start_codon:yes stop_codon:yes gene_type:complete